MQNKLGGLLGRGGRLLAGNVRKDQIANPPPHDRSYPQSSSVMSQRQKQGQARPSVLSLPRCKTGNSAPECARAVLQVSDEMWRQRLWVTVGRKGLLQLRDIPFYIYSINDTIYVTFLCGPHRINLYTISSLNHTETRISG